MIFFKKVGTESIITLFNINNQYDFEVTPYLINSVNWNKVMSLLISFREEYNDYGGRFVKSDLLGQGIEKFSEGKLKYINEDGCDFYLPEKNLRIEMKSGMKIFQTSKTNNTVELKIKNFNGNATEMEKTFDYLLLIDCDLIGVTSYENVLKYIKRKDDGFYCKIELLDVELFKNLGNVETSKNNLTDIRKKVNQICLEEIDRLYDYEPI